MEETVSRREDSVVRTLLRSSSSVVAGATGASAATGAGVVATTGAATTASALAAAGLRPLAFGASTTGAATATGAGAATTTSTASVFFATFLATVFAGAALIILDPVEELMGNKRTTPICRQKGIKFYQKGFNFGFKLHLYFFFF